MKPRVGKHRLPSVRSCPSTTAAKCRSLCEAAANAGLTFHADLAAHRVDQFPAFACLTCPSQANSVITASFAARLPAGFITPVQVIPCLAEANTARSPCFCTKILLPDSAFTVMMQRSRSRAYNRFLIAMFNGHVVYKGYPFDVTSSLSFLKRPIPEPSVEKRRDGSWNKERRCQKFREGPFWPLTLPAV
jgi:hypothetical protein